MQTPHRIPVRIENHLRLYFTILAHFTITFNVWQYIKDFDYGLGKTYTPMGAIISGCSL